jgi:hypothetical protein
MATDAVSLGGTLSGVDITPYGPGDGLPLFIQPADPQLSEDFAAFRAWFRDSEGAIDALLSEVGALVFRGFPVASTEDFGAAIGHYSEPSFGYIAGSAPRRPLAGKVFEATSAPSTMRIYLHQEMAYLPNFPNRLAFFCRMPSVTQGETLIGDMRRITAEMDPDVSRRVDEHGVLYTRNLRDRRRSTGDAYFDAVHRTWQEAFATEDPDKPLRDASGMGLGAEWLDDGSLSLTYRGAGFCNHPKTGERLWFNQLTTQLLGPHNTENFDRYIRQYGATGRYPYMAAFGDGTPITPEIAQTVTDTLRRCEVVFPWSSGDMMLIDNFRVAHGRNSFTGRRDVQVALLN